MRSNRWYLITFLVVLVLVGSFGIAATAGQAGEVGKATADAEELPLEQEVDTAAVEAYFAELENQRQIDAFLVELNRIEQEKAQAAKRAASQQSAAPTAPNYDPGSGSRWDQLAQCEAGGNWATNTGNGFGGGLQFMHQSGYSTWLSFGGGEFAPNPWDATREQQIVIAEKVLASSGWGAWPGCSSKFGWR